MAISGVGNTNSAAQTNASSPLSTPDNMQIGKEDFMKLLIAQLKNQDPQSPVDSKEFVTQLSQLTSVEQLTNMSKQLTNLQMATTSLVNNQASGFVGKSVEADASKLYLGASGGASSGINVSAPAETVTLTVRDDKGQPQRTIQMSKTKAGITPITWDGNDDKGEHLAAGTYTLSIEAKDKNGGLIPSNAQIGGIVSSVSYENGFPELVIGDARVALANVKTIK